MISTTIISVIIWWIGALMCLILLSLCTVVLGSILLSASNWCFKSLLRITQITTARYWVERMESEGLTICRKDYRKMVKERNPSKTEDFLKIENEVYPR